MARFAKSLGLNLLALFIFGMIFGIKADNYFEGVACGVALWGLLGAPVLVLSSLLHGAFFNE